MRRTDVAFHAELDAMKKLFSLQQEDNSKIREHCNLLDGEIDALKIIIQDKQKELNDAQITNRAQVDEIKRISNVCHETKLERSAFKVLENQNKLLLQKVMTFAKEIELLREELLKSKDVEVGMRSYVDTKVKMSVENEVKFVADNDELTIKLDATKTTLQESQAKCCLLIAEVNGLKKMLKMSEESRIEQVARSRSVEYKTLERAQDLSNKLQIEKDEKGQLQNSLELASFRGDLLQDKLTSAVTTTNMSKTMLHAVVNQLELSDKASRSKAKKLKRVNMILQTRLNLTQKAVDVLSTKNTCLESRSLNNTVQLQPMSPVGVKSQSAPGSAVAPHFSHNTNLAQKETLQSFGSIIAQAEQFAQSLNRQNSVNSIDTFHFKTCNTGNEDDIYGDIDCVSLGSGGRGGLSPLVSSPLLSQSMSMSVRSGQGLSVGSSCADTDVVSIAVIAAGDTHAQLLQGHQELLMRHMSLLLQLQSLASLSTGSGKSNYSMSPLASSQSPVRGPASPLHMNRLRPTKCGNIIDLSKISLTDENMKHMLEWFRIMSFTTVQRINLSHNLLTGVALQMMAAWIVALAPCELQRECCLDIDLRGNKISLMAINQFSEILRMVPRPEVSLVALEGMTGDNWTEPQPIVLMYGSSNGISRDESKGINANLDQAEDQINQSFSTPSKSEQRRSITLSASGHCDDRHVSLLRCDLRNNQSYGQQQQHQQQQQQQCHSSNSPVNAVSSSSLLQENGCCSGALVVDQDRNDNHNININQNNSDPSDWGIDANSIIYPRDSIMTMPEWK